MQHLADQWSAATGKLIAAFCRDRSANVAIIFGLALVPTIGLIGAAVDYSVANKVRTQLQAAADAASVGSVANNSAAYKAALTMSADGAIPVGVTDATNIFNGVLNGKAGVGSPVLTIAVARANSQVTSSVTYATTIRTNFMGIMGKSSMDIAGTATAANSFPTYIDFYLLLDNTPSMGVGATTSDINKMVANTPDKCAFACHDLSDPTDYYHLAKTLGVQMRIDVVRQATQKLMDTAANTESVSGQYRMAIYTMGSSARTRGLTSIQALTTNLTTAKTSASNIDLMSVPYQNYADDTDTDLPDALTDLNAAISTPGTGSSNSPQKYVFFVSDGVSDRALGSPSCSRSTTNGSDPQSGTSYVRCQEPLNVSYCTTLKNRGVKIAVLYTTYLPLPTNAWYNTWIAPFQSTIATNMQACATPGLYFEVAPDQGIADAMQALFQLAVKSARLTK